MIRLYFASQFYTLEFKMSIWAGVLA